jgi:hypothetical protein
LQLWDQSKVEMAHLNARLILPNEESIEGKSELNSQLRPTVLNTIVVKQAPPSFSILVTNLVLAPRKFLKATKFTNCK